MILVLLGTNPYPFTRLVDAVIEWASENNEEVRMQSGHTTVTSPCIRAVPFVEHAQIIDWIDEATVVICQGGFGSLQDCIRRGARIVAVPRLPALGEGVDDQAELVGALADEGLVEPVYDVRALGKVIARARNRREYGSTMARLQERIAESVDVALERTH